MEAIAGASASVAGRVRIRKSGGMTKDKRQTLAFRARYLVSGNDPVDPKIQRARNASGTFHHCVVSSVFRLCVLFLGQKADDSLPARLAFLLHGDESVGQPGVDVCLRLAWRAAVRTGDRRSGGRGT